MAEESTGFGICNARNEYKNTKIKILNWVEEQVVQELLTEYKVGLTPRFDVRNAHASVVHVRKDPCLGTCMRKGGVSEYCREGESGKREGGPRVKTFATALAIRLDCSYASAPATDLI